MLRINSLLAPASLTLRPLFGNDIDHRFWFVAYRSRCGGEGAQCWLPLLPQKRTHQRLLGNLRVPLARLPQQGRRPRKQRWGCHGGGGLQSVADERTARAGDAQDRVEDWGNPARLSAESGLGERWCDYPNVYI